MKFPVFSTEHFIILAATLFLCLFLPYWFNKKQKGIDLIRYFFGYLLIANHLFYQSYRAATGLWDVHYDLPMELCNWANLITGLALITKNARLAEIAWCWVMTASVNGVITPDFTGQFPEVPYITFFIGHSGLVIATVFLVYVVKIYPKPGAWKRVMLFSQVYFFSAIGLNFILKSNYGYMMGTGSADNAMKFFGPFPYNIISLELVAALAFYLILLPFRKKQTAH